jgi:sarcosine oxidase, subunit gamma
MIRKESASVNETSPDAGKEQIVRSARLSISRTKLRVAVLRIWKHSPADIAALEQAFDGPWPSANCTTGEDSRVVWLGPDEWAIINTPITTVRARLATALPQALVHATDLTDGRATFTVSGSQAPDILAKGCSIDLDPTEFGPRSCAQTLLANLPVLIERLSDEESATPRYLVHVDVSVENWLATWFKEAAREFAVTSDLGASNGLHGAA